MSKSIALTQGEVAIVDDCYFDTLMQYSWSFSCGYARRTFENKHLYLHQQVVALRDEIVPIDFEIDHINRNTLDNQSHNLRVVSSTVNHHNSKELSNNTSGVKGVHYCSTIGKWIVQLGVRKGLRVCLGRFQNFDDAVKARKAGEKRFLSKLK